MRDFPSRVARIIMKNNHIAIEKKWQKVWDEQSAFEAKEDYTLPKFYPLVEFPYPSGDGLHIGHPRPYTALDIVARKRRMEGFNVLYAIGWDAFGLPTENYAIKNNIHPSIVTARNIARFREQSRAMGFSFDYSREVDTTDPEYYRWTQWIFLQLFKRGLAYKKEMAVNFCTSCKVVLANEEVVGGNCERCEGEVVRKVKSQWMLKITEYAGRLIDDLEGLNYIDRVRSSQINWIGRSHGALVNFPTSEGDDIAIYTTRPDTLFGVTYMVLSPEHPLVEKWESRITNMPEVRAYQAEAAKKSDFERTELAKDKTGVCLEGVTATNPVNGAEIPVFISDYVLATYGTGAIMATPAHDGRDYEFAKIYGLPIVQVYDKPNAHVSIAEEAYTDTIGAVCVASDFLNGMEQKEAIDAIILWLEERGLGEKKTNYKLRDWVFSRQRYWGEPIPLVHCDACGWVAIPEENLPVQLPMVESYQPTDTGESPLAAITDWVATTCPTCGGAAERETDTMPNWAGSSWYFLRYCDPKNQQELASAASLNYWMPVDWYNGGMEHATLHVLYSRFWAKFLYDIGVLHCPEPYLKRTAHGMILGENNEKMSKSRGNVINPDDIIAEYGADTLRLFEMFVGDFEKDAPWSSASIKGCRRFLDRVIGLTEIVRGKEGFTNDDMERAFHKTIRKVSDDIESMKFNTAIAALMTLQNEITGQGSLTQNELRIFVTLLCPFAPHIAEEMWQNAGGQGLCSLTPWAQYDQSKTQDSVVEVAVQVSGKFRGTITLPAATSKDDALAAVRADSKFAQYLDGKAVVKEIFVPDKLVNIVVK